MIIHSPRWRVRRRPLLYGATAVLCGMTIALVTLSVVGYVRYQQLAAEARTATDRALETQTFAGDMGLLTTDGRFLYDCHLLYCTIALKPSTDTSDAARAKYLRIYKSGGYYWCEIQVDLFKLTHNTQTPSPGPADKNPHCLVDSAYPNSLMGTTDPDGWTRSTAVIPDLSRVDHIDFLDAAHVAIISVQVSRDTPGTYHLTALDIADLATQAATNSMKNLIAVSSSALLAFVAFVAFIAFGRIAAPRRIGPRRPAQRQGRTGSGTRLPSCNNTWTDRVTMGLIASAVCTLDHPDDQDRYREEWSADSDEIPGKWRRLRWALLLRLCAPRGIRSARRNALSMSPPRQQ